MINGGISSNDSADQARSIRISNMIAISAIANTIIFGLIFWLVGDSSLFSTCFLVSLIYISAYLIGILYNPTLGRVLVLISGNLIVFYVASIFRGEALLQLLYYSLSVAPFMHFSWEERKFYALSILPILLLVIGEYYNWKFFRGHNVHYNMNIVRIFSMVAPLHQIMAGFYYFLKQSVIFETANRENLHKLNIEHRKQLQVQKMSSLGEMAGGVSHEINNPLMVILGKTHSLKRELAKKLPPDDSSFNSLDKIDSMVHRISRIIRALRNFSRNSEHDPSELIKMHDILEMTLDLCQERFSASGIHLNVIADEEFSIDCRPTEISQVLLNLLNNSYDALKDVQDGRVTIHVRRSANNAEILIVDNGAGISPVYAEKIMHPFFTTKEIGMGTGLGLSISKGLIEAHKGSLIYRPDLPGTVFQILLPFNQR